MKDKYEDLRKLDYHPSKVHKKMDRVHRAAQFAPFAALTGYDIAILEASKQVIKQKILTEDSKEELNKKLITLSKVKTNVIIKVVYYVDNKKNYETKIGEFNKLDINNKTIIFKDKTVINFNKISSIESDIFDEFDIA